MASFSESDRDRLDWRLMQNGAVTLYFKASILESDLEQLRNEGYAVHTIQCGDPKDFNREMSRVFGFKQQFGYDEWSGNLDALNDAFFSLEFESCAGVVLCFTRFDLLKTANPNLAEGVLDIIEYNSRDLLLHGQRLLALVQSDDPKTDFPRLGTRHATWNQREWPNSARGL